MRLSAPKIGSPRPGWVLCRRIGNRLIVGASILMASCATEPVVGVLLPDYPPGRSFTDIQARQAIEDVARERERQKLAWSHRHADCSESFLASDCEERLRAQKRAVNTQLDRIELEARRAIREIAARQRNEREAARSSTEGAR